MEKCRVWAGVICILFFLTPVYAQAPTHDRLLFQTSLQQEEENEYVTITNYKGQFVNNGWQSTVSGMDGSRLILNLKNRLPQSATIEWTITNYDPKHQSQSSREHLFYMTSSQDDNERYYGDGSWVFLRTGTSYINSDGSVSMKIDVGAKGVDTRTERFIFENKQWNKNETYRFKLVYDNLYLWLYLDDQLVIQVDFPGQVKRFNEISFGGDGEYPSLAGPIFSDFSISTANNKMFYLNKTDTKGLNGLGAPGYGGHGIAVGDVNGDGLDDIYLGDCVQNECLRDILYIQQADGTFRDETIERGVADECCSHAVIFFDVDNDGDLDLFNANTWEPNQLYINDGNGFFTEESFSRGIENIDGETRGAVVFDVNNDGWLDIFAVNWGMKNEMYINDGTGKFRREYRGAEGAVEDPESIGTQGVTVADIDNDGDYEIYISKRDAENELYLNENGTFRNVAAERGVAVAERSDGATFADYDNDGDMDLFVANTRVPNTLYPIYLYVFENQGNGYFVDRTLDYKLAMEGFTPLFLDADNDGNLDLYRLRNNDYDRTAVAVLNLGDGAGNFSSAGYCGATVIGADARSCVANDFDGDGDLDLYITTKLFDNIYLENRSDIAAANWIEISTIGPKGDQGGIGSKIDVYKPGQLGSSSALISHREVVTQQGYLSGSSAVHHFGLGNQASCDVRVTLTDGTVLEQRNVAANQRIVIGNRNRPVLNYVSGDQQTGYVNQPLAEPFRVQLQSSEGTPRSGESVTFVVVEGSGSFESGAVVQTDAAGFAENRLVLGAQTGTVVAEARVNGADNSPIRFTATAEQAPVRLVMQSGDLQSGIVGQTLPQQIVVKTVYDDGSAAANVGVSLQPSAGGLVNGASSAVVNSNAQGLVAVYWTLGTTAGEQTLMASVADESATFYATAKADAPNLMQKISGDGQSLQPGVAFPQPFKVKLQDQYGNPVNDYPVVFQVVAGAGTVNGSGQVSVATDAAGMAGAQWTPDPYLGPENRLQATASYGGAPLNGSPIIWSYAGIPVSASNSTVVATGSVPADGSSASEITVTLRNDQNQNVGAGLTVEITASGSGNQLDAEPMTDTNGQVHATLRSTIGETKTITARVLGLNLQLDQQPTVEFQATHTQAANVLKISGDGEASVKSTRPLVIKVTDEADRPVPNHSVTFARLSGDGSFDGSTVQILETDAEGIATAVYTMGAQAWMTNIIEVRADSVDSTVRFSLMSTPGEAKKITIVSGNNQMGEPGTIATEPLVVNVKDLYDNNVLGALVTFKVNIGDAKVNGASQAIVTTDSSGLAYVTATFAASPGQSIVEAAINGVSISFTLTTTESVPRPDLSLSHITATSPVPADGYSTSKIVVAIIDAYGRVLPGIKVRIEAAGADVHIEQSDSLSDEQGHVFAQLSSSVAGEKTVMAYVLPENNRLEQVASVTFEQIDVNLALISGNGQTGTVGKACPESLVVQMSHDHLPVVDQYVKFSVISGGGHLGGTSELILKTNSSGQAAVQFFPGTQAGKNIVRAQALLSPEKTVDFEIYGVADQPTQLLKVSGDNQTGFANGKLAEPLVVVIKDSFGNRARGEVTFLAIDGGAVLTPQPVSADSLSQAFAMVQLGSREGRQTFKAQLANGAFVLFSATALKANTPPQIISYVPFETTLNYSYGERVHFEILNVYDGDGDSISYRWRLNTRTIGLDSSIDLYMSQGFPQHNALQCIVSDGIDSASVIWSLTLNSATVVEVKSFSGDVVKGKGVHLTWRIAGHDAIGFRVLRSSSAEGVFAPVSDFISAVETADASYSFTDETAQRPGNYLYRLETISRSGAAQQTETIAVTVQAPQELALLQNYPNPFNPTTAISFELPEATQVRLAIYNQKGQQVRLLTSGDRAAGTHTIIWDALDDQGARVTSGIYFYVLVVDGQKIIRKLTLLK